MEKRRSLAGETGIFNQDVFQVLFNYEVNRIQRYPGPTALLHIALAVDNFSPELIKKAKYGMANLLNRILRISDVPAHFGDEFLVLLPATDEDGSRAVAERILGHFRTTQNLAGGRSSKFDAFVGFTSRGARDTISAQELLAEAAVAMNEARLRQSFTYIAYSAIAPDLPKPK
jgi:GGDEF domain-containing protein